MRIIFMGTPEFSGKSLQKLYDDGHDIAAVFTGNDKPKGRGMRLAPSPVKEIALANGTPVYHSEDLTVSTVSALNCELIAVVAFGKILRREILDIPPLGCVNIHGSILPKYRGAAPIQHAILNGETETGLTSMYMTPKMDAGDMIFTRTTPIGSDETSLDLFDRLGDIGAELLCETIRAIEQGTAPRTVQNHSEATFAPMLTKDMAPIDWHSSGSAIKCKIRALIPWPVATMEFAGNTVKVYAVEVTDKQTGMSPGTVIDCKKNLEIACSDGTVLVTRLQAPGGKIMDAADFLRGHG